jgi:thiamine-phosphate pyrophosphorylase
LIGVGPVFSSKTKSFTSLAGLVLVEQIAKEIKLPAFAIGGINGGNVEQVIAAGMSRVAVSAAVAKADNPNAVARDLIGQLANR